MSKAGIAPFWSRREGTLTVIAAGAGLRRAGIKEGDRVTIDRALEPADGDIVLAWLDGSFQLAKLFIRNGCIALLSGAEERRIVRSENKEICIEGVCRVAD